MTHLNNLMVLHVHSNLIDELSLTKVGNEFISDSTHRETKFGNFLPADQLLLYIIIK